MKDKFTNRIIKLIYVYNKSDKKFHTLLMVASGTKLAHDIYNIVNIIPMPSRYKTYLEKMWDINELIVDKLCQTIESHLNGISIQAEGPYHQEFINSLSYSDEYKTFEAFLSWEQYEIIGNQFSQASKKFYLLEKLLITKPFIMKLCFYPWYKFQTSISFDDPKTRIKNSLEGYKIASDLGWNEVLLKLK